MSEKYDAISSEVGGWSRICSLSSVAELMYE